MSRGDRYFLIHFECSDLNMRAIAPGRVHALQLMMMMDQQRALDKTMRKEHASQQQQENDNKTL